MTTTQMSVCPNGMDAGTPHGTDAVRPNARPHVHPGVACWVQNQNQNQRFWLRLLVVVLGEAIHPSLRPVTGWSA